MHWVGACFVYLGRKVANDQLWICSHVLHKSQSASAFPTPEGVRCPQSFFAHFICFCCEPHGRLQESKTDVATFAVYNNNNVLQWNHFTIWIMRCSSILPDAEGTSLSCRITSGFCRDSLVSIQLANFWLCDLTKIKTFWLQEEWICHAAKQTEAFSQGICFQSKWNLLWFSWPVEGWEQHRKQSYRIGSETV